MKTLIAYYSRAGENYVSGQLKMLAVGNTALAAEKLQALTGGDLFRIEQVKPYSASYNTCIEEARQDQRRDARPALTHLPEHLADYDVIPELQSVLRYAGGRYATIAVHATSIGAWFSMHAFADARIEKCLFVSPLVDMPAMIRGMMVAAGVDRARLKREKEIQTDFGQTLSWDYLCFAEAHPARAFCPDTAVLYGGADTTVPRAAIDRFVADNECRLTVLPGGEHWFHTEAQLAALRAFEAEALS